MEDYHFQQLDERLFTVAGTKQNHFDSAVGALKRDVGRQNIQMDLGQRGLHFPKIYHSILDKMKKHCNPQIDMFASPGNKN